MVVRPSIDIDELHERLRQVDRGSYPINQGDVSGKYFGSHGEYVETTDWVHLWGALGELLLPISLHLNKNWNDRAANDIDLKREVFAFAGDTDRVVYGWLDPYISGLPDPLDRGERLLTSIVRSLEQASKDAPRGLGSATLLKRQPTEAEYAASLSLLADIRWVLLGRLAELVGVSAAKPTEFEARPRTAAPTKTPAEVAKRSWLRLPNKLPVGPVAGMVFLAERISRDILPISPFTASFPEEDFFAALRDERYGLPPMLAERFTNGAALMRHKEKVEQYGYLQSGIEPPGTTEIDRKTLSYVFHEKKQQSLIVVAPTSSGKSRFGQLVICRTVYQQKRAFPRAFGAAIVIVPTKALVNQVTRDLRALLAGTEAEDWEVIEGSRDYPQNDDQLRALNFDIAVIIPEKLSALVRNGMNVERAPLILIDELQHIVDGSRGVKLENLLTELFRRQPVPRIIGLSASLAPETLNLLGRWLDTNDVSADTLEVKSRPAPLTVTVLDGERRIVHRTHIPNDRQEFAHPLDASKKLSDSVRGNHSIQSAAQRNRRTLALILELLQPHVVDAADGRRFSNETPCILVFVNSKRLAANLTKAMRELVVTKLNVDSRRPGGLFARRFPALDPDEPPIHDDDGEVMLLAPGRLRTELEQATRTGIGSHTASLNAHGREIMEQAFARGHVRVLFATDTLRLGINLPADVVINGDILLNVGGLKPRLLEEDAVIQRLGRAGRLGLSRGVGSGYLVAPTGFPQRGVLISDRNRRMFGESPTASDHSVLERATKIDVLFDAYLLNWSGGAHYEPPLNTKGFEEMILQYLDSVPGKRLSASEASEAVSGLFKRSLPAAHGDPEPNGVLLRLERAGAIVDRHGDLRLTDTGRSSAANALAVDDLPILQRIAAAALAGAGPLTLIFLACCSPFVEKSSYEIGVRDTDEPAVRTAIFERLQLTVESSSNSRTRRMFLRHFETDVTDAVGNGAEADDFRRFIQTADSSSTDTAVLTAAWRALLIYLRWAGMPFDEIENPLKTDQEEWHVNETTLTALSESSAYLANAASDLLGLNPQTMHFRVLSYFSTEIELGVPAILAPFLFLRHRGMHRERVIGIQRVLSRPSLRWDSLSELFRHYVDVFDGIPVVGKEWLPLPAHTVTEVISQLDAYDDRRQKVAYAVDARVGSLRVPRSSSVTVRDELASVAQGDGPAVLARLLAPFGLMVEVSGDRVWVTLPAEAGKSEQRTLIIFPSTMVDNLMVDELVERLGSNENALVVAVKSATYGVVNRGRFLLDPVAIIDPSLLVELLARLYGIHLVRDEDPDAEEDLEDYEAFRVSLGGERPLAFNAELARTDLRRMFLNNAPVLSRADLENRMAYRDLADTP